MKQKRGISVTDMSDANGWMFKRVEKSKGKLTINEIRQAIIADGEQGYYAIIVKCVDDDMLQYFDDDLPEDAVDMYDADSFMERSGRSR